MPGKLRKEVSPFDFVRHVAVRGGGRVLRGYPRLRNGAVVKSISIIALRTIGEIEPAETCQRFSHELHRITIPSHAAPPPGSAACTVSHALVPHANTRP